MKLMLTGTGLIVGNKELFLEPTPDILKATEYTSFVLSWKNNEVNLSKELD